MCMQMSLQRDTVLSPTQFSISVNAGASRKGPGTGKPCSEPRDDWSIIAIILLPQQSHVLAGGSQPVFALSNQDLHCQYAHEDPVIYADTIISEPPNAAKLSMTFCVVATFVAQLVANQDQ